LGSNVAHEQIIGGTMENTQRWADRRTVLRPLAGGFALLAFAFPCAAQTLDAAEPPSIERVIIGEGGRSEIDGEGRPGNLVRLRSGDVVIGEAAVDANRRWRIELKEGLRPGTHQIRADALAGSDGQLAAGDEIRVAVPAEISRPAVVAYDGVTGDVDRVTRQRAEDLANAAGQAFDDVTGRGDDASSQPPKAVPDTAKDSVAQDADVQHGTLSVVIEWLKRSAREYRQDVVQKLGTPKPQMAADGEPVAAADGVAVSDAARTIAKERALAEARRIELAEADTPRKAKEAEAAAAEARRAEDLKRRQAEDLARRKADADKRIKDELERLRKAKEEADRAKAKAPAQKATITLERFYLPGEKRPAEEAPVDRKRTVKRDDVRETTARPPSTPDTTERCAVGRVTHRKGRRWYVTGANDTLWDIAERFYGTGLAYPRIYRVNRKRLSSPHIVRPCLALRLPRGRS
jgi:nucleoid-associated protein YgaU